MAPRTLGPHTSGDLGDTSSSAMCGSKWLLLKLLVHGIGGDLPNFPRRGNVFWELWLIPFSFYNLSLNVHQVNSAR